MLRLRPIPALALAAATAVAIAACGAPAGTSAPATGAPTTVAPASQPPASLLPGLSFGPGFSFELPSVDKELEGLLPDDIAGEAFTKSSVGGEAFLQGLGQEEFQQALTALGKTPADLTAALAGNSKAFLIAFRVKGVPAGMFLDSFVLAASEEGAQLTDITIGGKQAKRFSDPDGTTMYIYLTGDTIVTVSPISQDQAVLDEIFQKLG